VLVFTDASKIRTEAKKPRSADFMKEPFCCF